VSTENYFNAELGTAERKPSSVAMWQLMSSALPCGPRVEAGPANLSTAERAVSFVAVQQCTRERVSHSARRYMSR
jgi:hypothetical protein